MKAIIYTQYGPPDVLQLMEMPRPEPKGGEVLVKVYAASVNALDYRRFEKLSAAGRFLEERVLKSVGRVLGADIAGRVEVVGAGVAGLRPGDEVFGTAAGSAGGFAEYACASQNSLARKPANLSFEAAAAVPVAALTALQGLRDKGRIQPGQKTLIHGASGGVGTFALQIAKALGAEVTAVCSPRNVDLAHSLGADHVIDYTRQDFARNGWQYDLIFAVNGNRSLSDYRRALAPKGIYLCAGGALPQIFQAMLLGPWMPGKGRKRLGSMGIARINPGDLARMGELLEAGQVVPVVEKCYPLAETVAAIRYLIEGHARGKIVITTLHRGKDDRELTRSAR